MQAARSSNLLRNASKPMQVLVKDEVVFAPAADPYKALLEASERLTAGQTISHATNLTATREIEKAVDVATYAVPANK